MPVVIMKITAEPISVYTATIPNYKLGLAVNSRGDYQVMEYTILLHSSKRIWESAIDSDLFLEDLSGHEPTSGRQPNLCRVTFLVSI